jgi:hypothetical protein
MTPVTALAGRTLPDYTGHTLTFALCAAATPPSVANTRLTDLTQIAYTNLSTRVVTLTSSTPQQLTIADLTLTASAGDVAAFQYLVLYDDTDANDALVGIIDLGADRVLYNGDALALDFDGTNGILKAA